MRNTLRCENRWKYAVIWNQYCLPAHIGCAILSIVMNQHWIICACAYFFLEATLSRWSKGRADRCFEVCVREVMWVQEKNSIAYLRNGFTLFIYVFECCGCCCDFIFSQIFHRPRRKWSRKMIRNADDIVDSLRIYVMPIERKTQTNRVAITSWIRMCMCLCITCRLSNVGCSRRKKNSQTKQSKTRELMIKTHELNAK